MTIEAAAPRGDLTDWRQGSLVGDALRDATCPEDRTHLADLDWSQVAAVVVSQDCDICAQEGLEPYVDALPFVPLNTVSPEEVQRDAQCHGGRNPRRLVLTIPGRGLMAAEQWRRLRISKRLFHGQEPQGQVAVPDVICLRRWLGRRYTRAAFPDAFNDRLDASRKVRDKLDRLWASENAKAISGIYIRFIDEDVKLGDREITSPDEPYRIEVRVTYPVDTDPVTGIAVVSTATKAAAEKVFETFDMMIDMVDGIEMDDGKPIPETDFTLHDLRSYLRFDRDFRSNAMAAIVPLAADAP